jgi:hypothetical protein
MSNVTVNSYQGVGLGGWLTLIFVTLKLVGFITWSWWWVLSPIWIGAGIFLAVFLFILLLGIVVYFAEGR